MEAKKVGREVTIDFDQALIETLKHEEEIATDEQFLRQLADWILAISGDVNVTVRLKTIAESIRLSKEISSERTQ